MGIGPEKLILSHDAIYMDDPVPGGDSGTQRDENRQESKKENDRSHNAEEGRAPSTREETAEEERKGSDFEDMLDNPILKRGRDIASEKVPNLTDLESAGTSLKLSK